MRKGIIFLVLLGFPVQSPQRVTAGAFATEVTQLLNHAQLVLQYIRQGTQLAYELKMYADMLKNSRTLSSQTFGGIVNDINALASIVQGGQALAYSLGNLDQLFRQTYPGYEYNAGAYYTQYQNWSQTSLDTTLGALRAAGLQGQQLQSEQAVLASLRSSLLSTVGRLEALQALGDVSEQEVEQLMKLRELMMADMSSKEAYQAEMVQQQAASVAAVQRFFTYSPATSDGQTFGPGWHQTMNSRFVLGIASCLGLLVFGAACKKLASPEPHSEIVATVEKAGSGDLSSTTAPQIEDWLRRHRDLAVQVDDMCKPAGDKADANWAASAEGRVCTAARNASMFYRQYHNPPKPKGDAIGPGWH